MTYLKLLAQIINSEDIKTLPQNPLVKEGGSSGTITRVLQLVFAIAGAVTLLIITIGALQYVLSQGNPQSTNKAKDTILYALIGLIICIMAFSIVTFVIGRL